MFVDAVHSIHGSTEKSKEPIRPSITYYRLLMRIPLSFFFSSLTYCLPLHLHFYLSVCRSFHLSSCISVCCCAPVSSFASLSPYPYMCLYVCLSMMMILF